MSPELIRCTSELSATHDELQRVLGSAWEAAIALLHEPDDAERFLHCSKVAASLRDAQLHIHEENDIVFVTAERAGVSARKLEELRGEHLTLSAAIARVPPLLDRRETVEAAALSVLRLVSRFERHLAHEESLITSSAR